MRLSKSDIRKNIRDVSGKIMPPGAQVILFGSQARGNARPDSDWDILILLNKNKIDASDHDKYCYPLFELGWTIDEQIHPIIYTLSDWEKHRNTLLFNNIRREGVKIC